MSVQPIPDGFRTLTPHVIVKNCSEAIEFYKKAFGAEEVMRMPGPGGTVMYAELQIGNSRLMLNDEFPEFGSHGAATIGGTPVVLHLYVDDCDAWFERAKQAGATEIMPIEDQFWGSRYGKVKDPYGNEWAISTQTEALSEDEINARAAKMFAEGGQ